MVTSRKYAAGLRPDPILLKQTLRGYFAPRVPRLFAFIPLRCIQFRLLRKGLHSKPFVQYRFTATGGTDYSLPHCRGFFFLQINENIVVPRSGCYGVAPFPSSSLSFGCLRVKLSYSCKSQSSISKPVQPSSSIVWSLHLYALLNALSLY